VHRSYLLFIICVLTSSCATVASPPIVMDYRENPAIDHTEIEYFNGEVRLAATLLLPRNVKPHASAVLIHGSGYSTRMNVWAGMMAQLFVDNGIAVVFPDKRASGSSGGDFRTSEFSDLAGDAIVGVRFLRDHPELGAPLENIGLIGLSQGGRIVPMVAAEYLDEIAFVIDVSGGATTGLESLRHERANTYREKNITGVWLERFTACDAIVDRMFLGERVWNEYMTCAGWFGDSPYTDFAARIYPTNSDDWRLSWFPKVVKHDPVPYWRRVDQPVFIVYGANDKNENVPVARSVELLEDIFADAGKRNYVIKVYDEAGHALWAPVIPPYRFNESFVSDLKGWLAHNYSGGKRFRLILQ
jgi:pimeloyl-ACP methyl ester carboxylesterase